MLLLFLWLVFYHPFVSSEKNMVLPSGYFDYRRNQAWKRLLQSDKILVKLRGHLNHSPLSLGTWTVSSWNDILAVMCIIKMIKIDTKNNSPWFLILTFRSIIKNITEKLLEILVGLWTDISNSNIKKVIQKWGGKKNYILNKRRHLWAKKSI